MRTVAPKSRPNESISHSSALSVDEMLGIPVRHLAGLFAPSEQHLVEKVCERPARVGHPTTVGTQIGLCHTR